jgi:hypothetical protein
MKGTATTIKTSGSGGFSPVLGQNTEYYFYGAMGELLGAYELRNGAGDYFTEKWVNIYFAGRLIHSKMRASSYSEGSPVITDRLGSVRRGALMRARRRLTIRMGNSGHRA